MCEFTSIMFDYYMCGSSIACACLNKVLETKFLSLRTSYKIRIGFGKSMENATVVNNMI